MNHDLTSATKVPLRAIEPPPQPTYTPGRLALPLTGSASEGRLHLRHQVRVERLHGRTEGGAVGRGGARHALLQRRAQLEPPHGVEARRRK